MLDNNVTSWSYYLLLDYDTYSDPEFLESFRGKFLPAVLNVYNNGLNVYNIEEFKKSNQMTTKHLWCKDNNFIINVKDTSVMFIIGFPHFFAAHRAAVGASYLYFPSATVEMAGYLCMTLTASLLLRLVEKKLDGSSDYELVQGDPLVMTAGTYAHPDRGTPFDERSKEFQAQQASDKKHRERTQQELTHGRTRGER